MKKSLSLFTFVLVMGVVTSLVLTGANMITADRIAKNAEYTWKSAVLTHHGISHTQNDFFEIFEESFDEEEATNPDTNKPVYLYTNPENGFVSFRFSGFGLWDKIEGVITLEDDFYTIVAITVTEQGETPGLGGIVAEKPYLDKYVGKSFDETLGLVSVKNNATQSYEVDMITGATGTSVSFANLLTANQKLYLTLFTDFNPDAVWIKKILDHNDISYTNATYLSLFENQFNTLEDDDLIAYVNKTSGNISFKFDGIGYEGKPMKGILTLNKDWQTIEGVAIYEQQEQRGAAVLADPDVLGAFVGKKFNPTILVKADASADNEVEDLFISAEDGGSTVRSTKNGVQSGINNAYIKYYQAFKDANFNPVDETMEWKIPMLANHGIIADEFDYDDLFNNYFIERTSGDLTLYLGQETRTISFTFVASGFGGDDSMKGVLTLENDFKTIKAINVYYNNENFGNHVLNDPSVLDAFVGKKFNPDIVIKENSNQDNEVEDNFHYVDGDTHVSVTRDGLKDALNSTYALYLSEFDDLNMEWQIAMLKNNGHNATEANYKTLFNNNFTLTILDGLTLYTENTNKSNNFIFIGNGFTDDPFVKDEINSIHGVLTLEEDLMTIKMITVYYNNENRGQVVLENDEVMAKFIGKKFNPDIVIKEGATLDNEVEDNFHNVDQNTHVTKTRDAFNTLLNNVYSKYFRVFLDPNKDMKLAILDNLGILYTEQNYRQVIQDNFNILTKDDLTIYIYKQNGYVSFPFVGDGFTVGPALPEGGPGTIKGVLTLKDDFKTIVKVNVYENHERWGKDALLVPEVLQAFEGKKFNPNIIIKNNATADNEVENNFYRPDTTTSVSGTRDGIQNGLNEAYASYYQAFADSNKEIKHAILDNFNISYTDENYNDVFNSNFDSTTKDGLTLYTKKDNGYVSFPFVGDGFTVGPALPEGGPGTIKGVLTLKDDFKTIVKVNVYENHERWGKDALLVPEVLQAFEGKKFNPNIIIKNNATADNEVENNFYKPDTTTSVTGTRDGIQNGLNDTYALYYTTFKEDN